MIEINEIYKKKEWNNLQLFLIMGIGLVLFPIPLIAPHRFTIFSLIPFLSFSYLLFCGKKVKLEINLLDIAYIIFLGVGFLSYFWAINKSLIWYLAFGYLGFGLWIFLLRNLLFCNKVKNYLPILPILFFGIIQIYVMYAVTLGGIKESLVEWNNFFSYNSNYTTTLLVSLLPFFLFYKSNSFLVKFLKLTSIIFTGYLIFLVRAKGVLLSSIIIGFYYLWIKLSQKKFWSLIFFLAVLLCFGLTIIDDYSDLPILNEIGSSSDSNRFFMIKSSIEIFKDKPFLGIGLGNWFMEAYNRDITEIVGLDVHNFIRLGNHNLYSQHLAEIGILGFIGYYFSFIIVLCRGVKKQIKKNNLELAALASILVYMITSIVYRDVNVYENHFSGVQFLAFCSLGLLTKERVTIIQLSNKGLIIIWGLSFLTFFWFIYYHQTSRIYAKAQEIAEINSNKSLLLLESIYHPVFKTTHQFYRHSAGANQSIALKIAQLYQEKTNYDKAEEYYDKAFRNTPNDEHVLMAYSKFMLRHRNDYNKAKNFLLIINKNQKNHLEVNLLLAEIAIKNKKYSQAREYLNTRYLQMNEDVHFLEQQLYYSEYLDSLVTLNSSQKNELEKIIAKYKINSSKFSTLLLDKDKTKKELNRLRKNIFEETARQDKLLFKILSRDQFLIFLQDKYKNIYARQMWILNYLTSLTDYQFSKIEEQLMEVSVEKKLLTLEIESLSKLNNKQKILNFKQKIDSVGFKIDHGLVKILSTSQYKKYRKYQDKSNLFPK